MFVLQTCRWLDEYFTGREPDFAPPYRIDGLTPFRSDVIDAMLKIPFGKTVTYGEIAAGIARRAHEGVGLFDVRLSPQPRHARLRKRSWRKGDEKEKGF